MADDYRTRFDASRNPLPEQDPHLILEQLERFQYAQAAQQEWAKQATQCLDFVEGRQWTEEELAIHEAEGRPAMTFNNIRPIVRLVLGYQRQNRYDIHYQPGSDEMSTQQVAEDITHAAKNIHEANATEWQLSEAFRDGVSMGRGYLDCRLSFKQNLLGAVYTQSIDPHTTYPDPDAEHYEPSKWGFVFTTRWMSPKAIELSYGGKVAEEISAYTRSNGNIGVLDNYGEEQEYGPPKYFGLWSHFGDSTGRNLSFEGRNFGLYDHVDKYRKTIRVVDQQHYRNVRALLFVDPVTGATKKIPDHWKRDKIVHVIDWAAQRGEEIKVIDRLERRLRWTVTAADVVLHDEWSPYRTPTVIPYFGYFRRGMTQGLVHDLIDPQKEKNKRRSAEIHIVGTQANSGWIREKGALDPENENILEEFGARPGVQIVTNEGKMDKLRKIEPSSPAHNMERLEDRGRRDLFEISGVNEAAMGTIEKSVSGKHIEARQRQTVVAIETFIDNMSRTRHLLGEKYLELLQDHYTEERFIRIIGEGGEPVEKILNQRDAAGRIINDISIGQYMVSIDEAPASATFQDAQFAEAMELRERGVPIPDDMLIELSSMPMKEEIKERMAQMRQLQLLQSGISPELDGGMAPPPTRRNGGETNGFR